MSRRRLPSLGALRAFEAVARLGSLVAAAAELNVTHGAVSKQVQALEHELGVPLFERRNRGLFLTLDGQWLAERISVTFGQLEQTIGDFRARKSPAGPLTVSCEPTLCLRFLIPLLVDLKAETGLDVRVLAAGGPVDFRRQQVDVAIRRSDFAVPAGVIAVPLAPELMGPVTAPTKGYSALHTLPLLHSETRPHAWQSWLDQTGAALSNAEAQYEHFYLAVQAAAAGQGLAIASIHMVAGSLHAGALRAPLGFKRDGSHYHALLPVGALDDRRRDLIAWIERQMMTNVRFAEELGF
jgi:DNA-binding transcriptional LysR family regulator